MYINHSYQYNVELAMVEALYNIRYIIDPVTLSLYCKDSYLLCWTMIVCLAS